jgi:hypothetical protein
MAGIVRAADRVAFWHEAADDTPEVPESTWDTFKAPTSEPPSGAPKPPAGTPTPAPVSIPNSNKFKPANGLKKLLDTIPDDDQTPANSHPGVAQWLTGPTNSAFAGTYFKPGYQDALKATLGESNYNKLLKHAPQAHVTALTTHTQLPAPKSNKFTGPGSQLKKLLQHPDTQTQHVTSWLEGHPQFQSTYMKPEYDTALKTHLGDKAYTELQKHLKAAEQTPATPAPSTSTDPEKAQEQAQSGGVQQVKPKAPADLDQVIKDLQGVNTSFNGGFFADHDEESAKAKLLHQITKADHGGWHGLAQQYQEVYDKHFGKPSAQEIEEVTPPDHVDDLKAIQQEMNKGGTQPEDQPDDGFQDWAKSVATDKEHTLHGKSPEELQQAWAESSPQEKADALSYMKSDYYKEQLQKQQTQGLGDKAKAINPNLSGSNVQKLNDGDPDTLKAFQELVQGGAYGDKTDALQGMLADHYAQQPVAGAEPLNQDQPPVGAAVPTGLGSKPGVQHPALLSDIKKVFPNAHGDLDTMDDGQLKLQLENMLKYLPQHPGYQGHKGIPGIQKVYDKWFGGNPPPPSESAPDSAVQYDHNALAEGLHQLNPNFMLDKLKASKPEDLKAILDSQIDHSSGASPSYQALKDKIFGGDSPAPDASGETGGDPDEELASKVYDYMMGGTASPEAFNNWLPFAKEQAKSHGQSLGDFIKNNYEQSVAAVGGEGQPAQSIPSFEELQQIFPTMPKDGYAHTNYAKGDPATVKAKMEKTLQGNFDSPKSKQQFQALYDKYFGEPDEIEPADLGYGDEAYSKPESKLPNIPFSGNLVDFIKSKGMTPGNLSSAEMAQLKDQYNQVKNPGHPPIADVIKELIEGGGAPGSGGWSPTSIGLKSIQENPENAKDKLQSWAQGQGLAMGSPAQVSAKAVYDKYFGGDQVAAPAEPLSTIDLGDALEEFVPDEFSPEFFNGHDQSDAKKQQVLKNYIDNHPDSGLQEVYDKYFGGEGGDEEESLPTVPTDHKTFLQDLAAKGLISQKMADEIGSKQSFEKFKSNVDYVKDKLESDSHVYDGSPWPAIVKAWDEQQGSFAPGSFGEGPAGDPWGSDAQGVTPKTLPAFGDEQAKYGPSTAIAEGTPGLDAYSQNFYNKPYSQLSTFFKDDAKANWEDLSPDQQAAYAKAETGGPPGASLDPKYPTVSWMKQHWPNLTGDFYTPEGIKTWIDNGGDESSVGQQWIKDQYGDKDAHLSMDSQDGAPAGPPVPPPWDSSDFATEYNAIVPNSSSSVATGSATAEKAMQKVQQLINDYPGTEQTQKLQDLYDKWFVGTPGGGNGPAPGGGGAPEIQIAHPAPEEDEGVSAPFKGEEPTPEDLTKWSQAKPIDGGQWKDFVKWWGATKVTPEQEQAIYASWFPGKDPAKATNWFNKVYSFYSKPSADDLGASDMPSWAASSWAFGDKAETEWPTFKQWASSDPGIPKGLNIKQKLQIWNDLSAGDKKIVQENYNPTNPVDNKALVGALQAAYPDSDFSHWADLPQGSLQHSVENLAKAGFKNAIPIYNQYYGGNIPVPEGADEDTPDSGKSAPLKTIPIDQLPPWVSSKWGSGGKAAYNYTLLSKIADAMGPEAAQQLDYAKGESYIGYSSPLTKSVLKVFNALPEALKQQIASLPPGAAPFHTADEFASWLETAPKPKDEISQILPGVTLSAVFNDVPSGYYEASQKESLKQLMKKYEGDGPTYQALLGVYHKWFGSQHPTLAQALKAADPKTDWDSYLKKTPKSTVQAALKKQLKTEKDPEKWIQLVDIWHKYFTEQNSGVGAIKKVVGKNAGQGAPVGASGLSMLKLWKEQGSPTDTSPKDMYWYHKPDGWEPGNYIKSLADPATSGLGQYPEYMGWTPPGGGNFKADPAQMGDFSKTSYTAPEQAKNVGGEYKTLMDQMAKHKASFSTDEIKTMGSEEFQGWFASNPKGYRDSFKNNPGVVLDDFKAFMGGSTVDQAGPESYDPKVYDVSPFANVPKSKSKAPFGSGMPKFFLNNPQRDDSIKFPQVPDDQETLPGVNWAPKYAPMPVYRIVKFPFGQDPELPSWMSHAPQKDKELFLEKQRARLREIDTIIHGKPIVRNPEKDMKYLKAWGSKFNVPDKDLQDLAATMFSSQPTLGEDDKWKHFEDFANSHGIPVSEMTDLAQKMSVAPPPNATGSYDHPDLGKLILDYLEDWGGGGLGIHWTRDIDKLYNGISAAGVGPDEMVGKDKYTPVLLSGLWGGQGEGSGEGGAYSAMDNREREHNLLSGAPVRMNRVQIRDPKQDWHDLMDYGPMSMWSPGRDETAAGHKVWDKPSLSQHLSKALGVGAAKFSADDWDSLTPGYKADQMFNELVKKYPDKQAEIQKVYKRFFVGRPDLSLKPHDRRASLAKPTLRTMEAYFDRMSAQEDHTAAIEDVIGILELMQ